MKQTAQGQFRHQDKTVGTYVCAYLVIYLVDTQLKQIQNDVVVLTSGGFHCRYPPARHPDQ